MKTKIKKAYWKSKSFFYKKDRKELFYRAMLDAQMPKHQKRLLKIIKILKIDLKKESDRFGRILFNFRKKRDFYLSEV